MPNKLGIEGRMWVVIVLNSDYCFSIYSAQRTESECHNSNYYAPKAYICCDDCEKTSSVYRFEEK